MKNIYFDLCSIPIYCVILWTCYSKKLTKGNANRIFIAFSAISLFCAIADIWMEFVVNPLPSEEFVKFIKEHNITES